MIAVTVIDKKTAANTAIHSAEVTLTSSSVVQLGIRPSQVKNMNRVGDDLVVTTHSGEVITVHAFFQSFDGVKNDVVLQDDEGGLWLTGLSEGQGELATGYTGIDSVEPLLLHQSDAGGVLPWLIGGAGLLLVAAGAGGGGSGPVADTTPPAAPAFQVGSSAAGEAVVTGRAEAGSAVTVSFPDGTSVQVQAGTDGSFTATSASPQSSGTVTAHATDAAGNVGPDASQSFVDVTAPEAPVLHVTTNPDGSITVSGGTEPGNSVLITHPDGSTTTVVADANGNFTDTSSPNQPTGDVTATATDAAGNTGGTTTIPYADVTAPDAPAIQVTTNADGSVTVVGQTEPGISVQITYPDGSTVTLGADESGTFTDTSSANQPSGDITAAASDSAGNAGDTTTVHYVDVTAPEAPTLEVTTNEDGSVTVVGQTEPGNSVDITYPDGSTVTVVADASGSLTDTSAANQPTGEVTGTATDAAGNTGGTTTVDYTDVTAPEAPTLEVTTNADGSVTVVGQTEPGNSVEITYPDGSTVTVVADASGSFTDTSAANQPTGEVTGTATDPAGNAGDTTTVVYTDVTAPAAPELTVTTNADGSVTVVGQTEPGNSVEITYPDGSTVTVVADAAGSFTDTSAADQPSGDIAGTATDPAGNTGDTSTVAYTDVTAPDAPSLEVTTNADGSVTVGGQTEPGNSVEIKYPDGTSVTVVADASGIFSDTSNVDQPSGEITGTATDPAGNTGDTTTVDYTDVTAPEAPTLEVTTNEDGSVTVVGQTEPGNSVEITYPDGSTVTVVADASGSFTDTSAVNQPSGDIVGAATDPAGNTGDATTVPYIDSTVPVGTALITGYTDDVVPITGDHVSGTSTNDTTPLLKGTVSGLVAGDIVRIYEGTTLLGTATVSAGSWSYQLGTTTSGAHSYTAVVADAAGNDGATSAVFTLTMDTTNPGAIDETALNLVDDVGTVTGTIVANSQTDDSKPTYSGTADASQVVAVNVYDNGLLLGSATVQADGSWTFEPALPLASGPHSFTAQGVDAAGNTGPRTSGWAFTLLGAAPPAPAITLVSDDQGAVVGALAKGQTTDDLTPTVSGTGTVGTVVTVYADGVAVGSVSVAANGTWSITTSDLGSDGTKILTAHAVDGAGQSSPSTGDYAIVLDSAAPTTPGVVVATDDQGAVTGVIASGGTTDDTAPTFSGTGMPGDVVKVYDGSTLIGSATVAAGGTWSFTPSTALSQGSHSITTTATDAAGNTSASSPALSFTVDTSAVVVSISRALDDAGNITADLASGASTDDTTPTLVGTATAGAIVTISEGATVLGSATAQGDGSWSFVLPVQTQGAHSYTAVAANAAGTNGTATFGLTIDTTASGVPAIGGVLDDVGAVQGPLTNGGSTDDTTPTISGTGATAGDTIRIYDNGSLIGSATVAADGSWSYTPTTPLTEATHVLTATSVDPVGNESAPSTGFTVVVDITAPSATAAISAITTDSGTSATDFVTSDQSLIVTATVTGTVGTGERVQISVDGGATWHDATLVSASTYQYDNSASTLAAGNHTFEARVVDAAGNASTPGSQAVVIDTSGPTTGYAVAITGYTDDVAPNTADYGNGTSTNDTTPLLKGTVSGLVAGDIVRIYEGTTLLGTATVSAGSWSYQLGTTTSGAHSYTAVVADAAGNDGATSAVFTLTVDTTVPGALNESALTLVDDVGAVTGTIVANSQTDDSKPTYSGTADAAQVTSVNVYDNGLLLGSAAVQVNGTWAFEPTLPLASGPHSFTAQGVDAAGNTGPQTSGWAFTLLGAAPPAPAITLVSDDQGAVTGALAKNQATDDATPTVSGTGTVGTVVTVYADGVAVGSVSVAANGTWSITTSDLGADGTKVLTAQAVDGAGQASPSTGDYAIVLDSTAPVTPGMVTATDDQGAVTGPISSGSTTDDTAPTFSGTGIAGDVIKVYDGATLIGSATVAAGGSWSFTPSTALSQGAHSITTTATDAAGNTSAGSMPLAFTVDTSAVVVSISRALDDVGSVTADLASGASTDDTTPTLLGTATAGAIVTISEGATLLGSTTAQSDGSWSFVLPVQTQGAHSYTAVAANAAGTNGSATFGLTIDTTASGAPAIGGVLDDVGAVQGNLANGGSTDDTTPTISGTGATAGDMIRIYDNGSLIGTTTVGTDGSWSYTPTTPLTEATHVLTATSVDPVGNESAPSTGFTVVVDLTAPSALAAVSAITSDSGTGATDFVTSDQSLIVTATVTGTVGTGERVQISVDAGATWYDATLISGSTYQYDHSAITLAAGTYTFEARVVDAAGNASTPGKQAVVIDTSGPTTGYTVAITGYTDDVAPNTADYGNGTSTNDTTPLLKGMVSGLVAGDVVRIYEGTTLLGTATVSAGSWSYQLGTTTSGAHSYTAVVADAAGNDGATSAVFTLTVDTTNPGAIDETALNLVDDVGTVTGTIVANSQTDDSKPTYSGTADASQVVAVNVYDNGLLLGSATVQADGSWTFEPALPLASGPHSFTAQGVDAAGNTGPQTSGWAFTLLGAAPPAPAITLVSDDQGTVTGALAKNQTTDDATPTVSGTGTVGTVVTVYADGVAVGSTSVLANGTWSIATADLGTDGTKTLTAQAVDGAGQASPSTGGYAIVLDTTAPTTPSVVTATDDQGAVTGPISSGSTTDDMAPTFSGTGTAGDVVKVYDGATLIGSATVAAGGTWSFTPSTALSQGAHSITTTATDAAGNTSAASSALAFTVDTSAVVVSISRALDDAGGVTADLASGASTDDTTPTLVGTATAGAIVTLSEGATVLGSTTAQSDGSWSFSLPTQSQGSHTYTAVAANAAGTNGSATFALSIDTTASGVPAIGGVLDDVGAVQGNLANGGSTDDTTPTISGVGATAGDMIRIYDNGSLIGTTTVGTDGSWSYTPTTPLTEATHVLTLTSVDPVGNESLPSAGFTVVVDLTPPNATAAVSAITTDSGTSTTDFVTSDQSLIVTATVTGTVSTGERVQISVDGGTTWHDTALVSGSTYQYDNSANTLAAGNHTFEARVVDAAGNASTPGSQAVVIDTSGPTTGYTVVITGYTDDVAPVTGDHASGTSTNDTTPLLKGTVSGFVAGDIVRIYEGTTLLGTATVGSGSWSYQLGTTTSGSHSYTAVVADAAGNDGATSNTFTLTVDTTNPGAIDETALNLVDDVGAVTGTIVANSQTDDSKPTYSGTADAAQVTSVNVYDNGLLLGSAAVQADGSWSFEPALPLASGPHSFTAQGVDAAGNTGPQTSGWVFTLLGAAPPAPAITLVSDDQGTVTGALAKGQTTDDTTPTVSGTGTVGTVVTVYADGVAVGSTSVLANGTWSITTSDLGADGTKVLTAQAVDGAGQASPSTGDYAIVLDKSAPATPGVVTATDDQGAVTGPISSGSTTDDMAPTFSGSGTAGDVVKVYDGATLIGSATVAAGGSWSLTPSTALSQGAHSITTTATDAAGNTSAASTPLAFTVDTSAVVVSISKALDDAGSITANLASGASTDDTTPTLVGTATAGAIVTISEGATLLGSTTAQSDGSWSFSLPTQSQGNHTYTAIAANAAGTNGSATFALTIDTTASGVPSIGGVTDDVGAVQGPLTNGGSTDDTTPTISGTGATAGDTIRIYDNGSLIGTTTVGTDGSWSYTPTTPLTESTHVLTATSVDPVGNESAPSAGFTVVVDITAPKATAAISAITSDTGTSATDFVTSDQSLIVTATVTGTVGTGERVQISVDGGTTWHDTTLVSGSTYQYDNSASTLAVGNHTFEARVVDAAGNASAPGTQAVVIDTSGPDASMVIAIASISEDTGASATDFITTDTSLTINGTLIGTLGAGESAQISVDGTTWTPLTVSAGAWSYVDSRTLAEGNHTYQVRVIDSAGNIGSTDSQVVTVDTSAPNTTSIVIDIASISTDSGTSATDFVTSDKTLTLNGTLTGTLGAGEVAQISVDGTTWTPLTVSAGAWSYVDSRTLTDGNHTYQVRVIDAAGNLGSTDSQLVTVDTSGPTTGYTVAITAYTDDVAPNTADYASGTSTNDTTPLLKGMVSGLTTGDVVHIYEGSTLLGAATVSAGNWTYQLSATAEGVHSYTAVVVDLAGNAGVTSSVFTFTVDITAPLQTVAITNYADNVGDDQGSFSADTVTDDRTPVLHGTLTGVALASGEVVSIYEGTTLLGAATVTGSNWIFALPPLADNSSHVYRAVVEDAAGNQGSFSAGFNLSIDLDLFVKAQDTLDTTPIVTGLVGFEIQVGEYVEVTINGVTYSSQDGAVVVDPLNNSWYVQIPNGNALAVGTYSVAAVLKDPQGNVMVADDTSSELKVSATPAVTVGAGGSDPEQKATAVTLSEDGVWRIHSNQAMLDSTATSSSTLGNFATTTLVSNNGGTGYETQNYVQNATFMDYNRDGLMDLFAVDSRYNDGQQMFYYNGTSYTAYQVGAFTSSPQTGAFAGDANTDGSANTWSWYGGIIAIDKNGDGLVDLINGDQTPNDSAIRDGYGSQIVLNNDGTIVGMSKDGNFATDYAADSTHQPIGRDESQPDMELSGVDINNDGIVDFVMHSQNIVADGSRITATGAISSNQARLVVVNGTSDGTWNVTQVVDNVFQRGTDSDPYIGNGVAMTWADFNGDGYMDLFLGRGSESTTTASGADNTAAEYASRIYFNDGTGKLVFSDPNSDGIGNPTAAGMYTFTDNLAGGASIALDWNHDGKIDVIELPGMPSTSGGITAAAATGPINLYTNTTTGSAVSFATTNLITQIGATTIGTSANPVTGAIAVDVDWDGDRDLLAFTSNGTTTYIANTNTVATGTSIHLRILDAEGINSLYGNTVQLIDQATGQVVATQTINAQSGNQTNDSSAIVDFYNLDATKSYSAVILRYSSNVAADVGGVASVATNTVEIVNSAWAGLKAAAADSAYVLTTEAATNVANASANDGGTNSTGIVGTGYNDTFFATLGNDHFEGGGGTVEVSGVKSWSNTGGIDIVDYKLAGSTALTIDLSKTAAQSTGFGIATFSNIEGLAGGSGNDTFTGNAADNQFEGRGGNDTFHLGVNGGRDTLMYKLLVASNATGGNGTDVVTEFKIGTYEATADADRIDVKALLTGYVGDADGAAHYINGVATIDAGDTIASYLSVTTSGGNTTVSIDRDGAGTAHTSTTLLTLNGVTTDLATLLANHQLVVF